MSIPIKKEARSLKLEAGSEEKKVTGYRVHREDDARLPIGLQLTARHGDEATLFEAGKEFLGE